MYASEDEVEGLLCGACARHAERLESVSRRDSASRAEVEQLARTLCAEDFPLWRLDGHSAERPPHVLPETENFFASFVLYGVAVASDSLAPV